ncbi:magnesium transporter CorA family protein [Pseudoclavibacter sp. JSM 162008]|uniref:magnesium transporter CorA family protein n=1 Tax=Pseudoclavibacter sp. JSM 162008 TaxID=3229855 RepID=UPI00352595AD
MQTAHGSRRAPRIRGLHGLGRPHARRRRRPGRAGLAPRPAPARRRRCEVPWLVWALLDVIVDSHTDSVERLDEVIEALSDGLFSERPDTSEVQRRAFTLRRSVSKLRHATLPLKEVITLLIHQGEEKVAPELHPYFADVGDHAALAADWSETLADHISTAIETSIALQGNKMNEIMKKVTGWAAIIAVPTAITGFFGMNVDFPGHNEVEGLIASVSLVIGSSVVLYIVFKRRDWL